MITTLALSLVPSTLLGSEDLERNRYDRPRRVPDPGSVLATAGFLDLNADPEGDGPVAIAYTPDGRQIAVVNRDSDAVMFLDAATRDLLAVVPVGDHPLDIAITPDGSYAVVPNAHDHTVSRIDLASHTVTATIPVTGTQPYQVVISADSQRAAVGVINQVTDASMSVLDLQAAAEVLSFPTSPQGAIGEWTSSTTGASGQYYASFALSPDGKTLLLPNFFGKRLGIYDVTTGNKLETLFLAGEPTSVEVSDDGHLAVVSNSSFIGSGVQSIDLTTLTLEDDYQLIDVPFYGNVVLSGDKSFAACVSYPGTAIIDLNNGSVHYDEETSSTVALSFDDQYVLAAGYQFRVLDPITGMAVAELARGPYMELAASPVGLQGTGLINTFAERLEFLGTDGANTSFQGLASTGSAPEADAPRAVALTPDGRRVLVANYASEEAAFVDLETCTVLSRPEVGMAAYDAAVTRDGTTGLLVARESETLAVIDLVTGITVAELPIGPDPQEVVLSPDGGTAYVRSDRGLHVVRVDGANSTVTDHLVEGWVTHMELSPEGTMLALLERRQPFHLIQTDLRLLDTTTGTELATFEVGILMRDVIWSSDASAVYVTSSMHSGSLTQFRDQGGVWAETGTAVDLRDASRVTIGPNDKFLYVACRDADDPHLRVVRAVNMNKVAKVPLTDRPEEQTSSADMLLVALRNGEVARIRMDGPSTQLVESVALPSWPTDIAFSPQLGAAVVTQPVRDGLEIVPFGGTPITYCSPAVVNSSGAPGVLTATGTFLAGGQPLNLEATQLPVNEFGLFLTSDTMGLNQPPGSQGNLCLGGTIHRYATDVQFSGAAGSFDLDVDTTDLPLGGAIQPGETWNFQAWFRDANPTPTSNFTDAVSATFE